MINNSHEDTDGFVAVFMDAWDDRDGMALLAETCEILFESDHSPMLLAAYLRWKDDGEIAGKLMTALTVCAGREMELVEKVLVRFGVWKGERRKWSNNLDPEHELDLDNEFVCMRLLANIDLPNETLMLILNKFLETKNRDCLVTLLCRAVLKSGAGDNARECAEMRVFYELAPKQKSFADYVIGFHAG